MRAKIAVAGGWTTGISLGMNAKVLLARKKGLKFDMEELAKQDELFWKLHWPCEKHEHEEKPWLTRHDKDLVEVLEYCIETGLDNGCDLEEVKEFYKKHPDMKKNEPYIPYGENYFVKNVELPSGRYYIMDCGDYEKLIIPEKIDWVEVEV